MNHSAATPPSDSGFTGRRTTPFLLVMFELALIAATVYLYDIEGRRHFFPVLCLMIGGFAIHTWLPRELRLRFFALLSVVGVLFVLGIVAGAWVLAVGAGLIGICYLPLGFWVRLGLLGAAGGVLAFARVQFPLPFWPVLGSLFMFRLMIYVYDTRRSKHHPPLASSIAYFFVLPNACFPLFPVVDYKTFRDTWYDEDEWAIYQRGVVWIARGLTHLLLYRFVKSHLVPEPYELQDLQHIALFMVTNYALYLQVSGQFHLITGLLHLFGFNLPRTHYLFFLASSCNDIWRRINIYWKDVMMKLFFLPTFFALRSRGVAMGSAIVCGVFCVFVCTWLLHSWQAFWLLGEFPLAAKDAALWLSVGTFVAINALLETRRPASRAASRERPIWLNALNVSLRTAAMFVAVSLFWACWTIPGFLSVFSGLLNHPRIVHDIGVVLAWFVALVAAGTLFVWLRSWRTSGVMSPPSLSFRDSVALHSVGLGMAVAVGLPSFGNLFDSKVSLAIAEFRSDSSAGAAAFSELQSYYENMNAAVVQAGPLLSSLTPEDQSRRALGADYAALTRPADPLLELELIPGIKGELDGSRVSINQFGMRDRNTITLKKPADTIRIALVGSSVVMGYGVADDEVFGRLFETGLNAARPDPTTHYEVLNFGVGKHWAIHRLALIDHKVFAFQPDAIYYFAHQDELEGPLSHLTTLVSDRHAFPYPALQEVVERAGIKPDMAGGAVAARLHRFPAEIVSAVYHTIVEQCRARGVLPVWIYLPIPGVSDAPDLSGVLVPIAEDAGFVTLDLSDWSQGHDPSEVKRTPNEHHPDARGHRLIAEALLRTLQTRPEALPVNR